MNILFSFHTRSNFLSQALLIIRTIKTPNPSHRKPGRSTRFFSVQSPPSFTGKPPIACPPPPVAPNPNPNPNFDCNDFTAVCNLLENPSFPPGPALESALDRTGIELCPALFQQIFDRFGSDPKIVLNLFIWAEKQSWYRFSADIFNSMIKVLARAREFDFAWTLILGRLKQGIEGPDMDTFVLLIRRYARAGMPSPALRTLEFEQSLDLMSNPDSEPNLLEILLNSFCKEGLVREASEYFDRKKRIDPSWIPSTHVYNILLHGWCCSRQLEHVERLWDEMKKNSVKPSVLTYGTLVKGYCRMGRVEVAIELVGEMRRVGIEPDAIVYNSTIDALGEAGRFKEALAMMERFLVLESGPTISTYNSLVKCFCKADDLEGANKILKMMISRGFMPTTTTYNYFLRSFSKSGKIDAALNLYTKIMESGYAPDRLTYNLLMNLLCKQERLDLAMEVRKEMKTREFDLDTTARTMLVHLLCTMHRFEEAFQEFEEMIQRGIFPHYITYQKMIDELKEQRMFKMAHKLCDLMPSVPHSIELPNAYARDEDASRARRTSIMRKAKGMSDTLKTCRDPRELVKRRCRLKNVQSDVSVAD
ncbi:pentatricopeptide repeat (PPR) superfamily protein [Actinidia rufa]|uniref:Pentatricopeptide repeat (PPR) superfamily protein n=1 Tax=Actinidia rufa TaxID=165716 RepID=A0A7J0GC95_9ERIC|nr:pentatricopeptide repeat (PPR) superfamily protein [Actinidia rufa]